MLRPVRAIKFRGNSRADLRGFPEEARREAGLQLSRVQQGEEPGDWKPMGTVGPGVREIRIREKSGAYRVIYAARLAQAIYVLHCFQKKTQKTTSRDLALVRQRYQDLIQEVGQ